jgi:transcriptional regulator with XRE-family HTH domain
MNAPMALPFGQRLKRRRERLGMSRPVLGGLVGKSGEWVKAVESGRLQTPRLSMVLQLAQVLQVSDLADLVGDERITSATFGKAAHDQLPVIASALAQYPISAPSGHVSVDGLAGRVEQAWLLWHGSRSHRSAVATVLPGLLGDSRAAARQAEGPDRRSASRSLAQTYHLAQLYLSFQPTPELVTLTGDRAMTAAQDTDDPSAIAAAAWYLNHVFRDAGQQHEARVQLALDVVGLLTPERSVEGRALWGLMHLAVALSYAKVGQEGRAWHHWDRADEAVNALPVGYVHPWLMFGRAMVDTYAVTILVDLMRGGEAARRADTVDLGAMPSATRRSYLYLETARAYHQEHENVAVVHLLAKARHEAPETADFNLFGRAAIADLAERGGMVQRDAIDLAAAMGLAGN